MDTAAGVVLAGGRSARMGEPKAGLAWHGSTLLYRASALLTRTVGGPVVVVAAPGQTLPPLPREVVVVRDPVEGLGPMQGVAAGLAAVADRAETAFVCSTDMPFLHPAFVARVLRELSATGADMVLPVARGFRQPLASGYRTSLAGLISDLVGRGELKPGMLYQHCEVAILDDAALLADPRIARLDPGLESVRNVNTPEDFAAAVSQPPPEILLRTGDGERRVRAAVLGDAVGPGPVLLNGSRVGWDASLPLVAGDTVTTHQNVAAVDDPGQGEGR